MLWGGRSHSGFSGFRNPLERQLKEGKLEKMGSVVLGLDGFDTLHLGFSSFGGRRETTPSSLITYSYHLTCNPN
ncbi:hypothetical protein Lser_V15G05568 [Lactuca serriola]